MNAINAREGLVAKESCNRLVRKDHGFFNELGCIGLTAQIDIDRRPFRIKTNASFHGLEINAADLASSGCALLGDEGKTANALSKVTRKRENFGHGDGESWRRNVAVPVFKKLLSLVVGKTCRRLDDRRVDIRGKHLALGVEVHINRYRSTSFKRTKRAQVAGKFFWKHGNHTVDKINAGCAPSCIEVD